LNGSPPDSWVWKSCQVSKAHIPAEIDVRRIRKKASKSQSEFAAHFGVSVRTVQDWEEGRRVLVGASRAFLVVIDREPEAVHRALTAALA
jgi:putative transcriptional regulator